VKPTLRRGIAVAAVLLAAPAVASCGFDEPTDQVYNPTVGVNDRSGSIDVLHALVVSGSDGSGTFIAGLANNDNEQEDRLTNVAGDGEERLTVTGGGPVDIPAGGFVQLADEGGVPMEGERLAPGNFVDVTLSFERGESVTLRVPVLAQRGDYADIGESATPTIEPGGEPTGEPTEGATDEDEDLGVGSDH
jgi:hypothetical protein